MTIFRSCLFSRKLTLKAQEPRIFKYFIGDRESFPLEKRVLNALLLASSLLATLLVIEALVFDYSNALVLSSVAATIFWILYFVSVQLKDRDWPLWTYLFASGFIIFADWFFVGGQAGLAPLILVAISASSGSCMLLRHFIGTKYQCQRHRERTSWYSSRKLVFFSRASIQLLTLQLVPIAEKRV